MSASPLSDITVIEVAEGVAGAFCGRMLAAFGANVIKVECPPKGDWTRLAEPQLEGIEPPEAGALFLFNNMGKKGVTIDWTKPEGMTVDERPNILAKAKRVAEIETRHVRDVGP